MIRRLASILLMVIVASCSIKPSRIVRHEWRLEDHDSLVKDSMLLNKIRFRFDFQHPKTLSFHRDKTLTYYYKRFPFYNWSGYWICGTDELELDPNSTRYHIKGDTLYLRFKGSEFSTPGCCYYDIEKEFKIDFVDRNRARLSLIRDLSESSKD